MTSAWNWDPEAEHPCNIERISRKASLKRFGPSGLPPLYPNPIVIITQNDSEKEYNGKKAHFRKLTEKDNLLELFGKGFMVTLSSSNARSEHRRTVSLEQYVDEILTTEETRPDQLSNETWYLFGETHAPVWKELLLRHYVLPDCQTCVADLIALSFGIGNRGSGVQWHTHGPGFSETIHGRKHWVLYPPSKQPPANFHKDQSSRQWMEFVYANKNSSYALVKPFECTLGVGEMIYFPDEWWHATINLDPYTVFVSSFTTEHQVQDENKRFDEL